MQKPIEVLSLMINTQKDVGLSMTREVLSVLSGCPVTVRICDDYRTRLPAYDRLIFCREEDLLSGADCALVLGGDGSVIKAAGRCARDRIPILGVNLGRVGYLAEVERDELRLLSGLCRGEYRVERRMMLDVSVYRGGKCIYRMPPALNDAVISNGAIAHMVELSVSCGGDPVTDFHADGVIVATPTGSTAYSMSAGGPIIDPAMDCVCVTPVCSHSLTARPMVLSPDSPLSIENICTREDNTFLTVDGVENYKLLEHDVVQITRAAEEALMIRFHENSFYSVLGRKMRAK